MRAEVGLSLAASHPELVLSLICEGALFNEFGEYGLFNGTSDNIQHKKEVILTKLDESEDSVFKTKEEYIEKVRAEFTQQGVWNEYFLAFVEHNLQKMQNGNFTPCYLKHVRKEYIQKYLDVKFELYYKKLEYPVLFLPSEEEWKDEKIKSSLYAFTDLLAIYEIAHIENSIHAYVWMQLPLITGELAKNFINKHDK